MDIICLDMEGVLTPEMWIVVAERTGTDELRLTTRDISDYDQLMRHRIEVLKRERITLPDIQRCIRDVEPLAGARAFLDALRKRSRVVLLSDTFIQFVGPIISRLGYPLLLCNELVTDAEGMVVDYRLRQANGKRRAVEAFRDLNLRVLAVGDSFNDIAMLRAAHQGFLFQPSKTVSDAHPDLARADDYDDLLEALASAADRPVAPEAADG